MHDTFFDVDFVETGQNEVGTSRMKLLVHRNVEPDGVEPNRHGGVSVEGVSEPPKVVVNWWKVLLNRWNVSIERQKVLVNRMMPCCC